ncbi:MAG: ATP-binding protein [Bacteroidales bacterium]|nr:ATP-binding protein [Bacteroidales bacterium]
MLNSTIKKKIVAEIIRQSGNYPSAAKMAKAIAISPAQLSRIKKGDIEQVLADSKWISIARKLGVELNEQKKWNIARTPAFEFILAQLTACQQNSVSLLLCDSADIGKTFTAKVYARENKHTAYVDCSQVKTKQRLVRKIATEFGVDANGRYADVYEDLIFYLKSLENPLIILDEAGDLQYPAFLELKALWNATERSVGWYMMGADGLKAKIERNLGVKKVGYTELFSRFGGRYQKITPEGKDLMRDFNFEQASKICIACSS